jgi:hypothetical protein
MNHLRTLTRRRGFGMTQKTKRFGQKLEKGELLDAVILEFNR